MKNIYLTGMMGSGKSATGKALAVRLGYEFTDLDSEIENRECRPITEIFSTDGETYFRNAETETLKKFSVLERTVFATGGGIVLNDENVVIMKKSGIVILLKASLPVLWERVCQKKDRPLLNTPDPKGSLKKIFESREERYQSTCDQAILTDGLTPDAVAKQILGLLK